MRWWGRKTPRSVPQFHLRMWLGALAALSLFLCDLRIIPPLQLLPGWRRNKARAQYVAAVSLNSVFYAPAPAQAGAGFAFQTCVRGDGRIKVSTVDICRTEIGHARGQNSQSKGLATVWYCAPDTTPHGEMGLKRAKPRVARFVFFRVCLKPTATRRRFH